MSEGDREDSQATNAQATTTHRIVRSDGQHDGLTRQAFSSYDMAYEQLERYYGDLCCSDDDRIDYIIVAMNHSPAA